MPVEYQTPAIEDRAVEVQTLLADLGRHRAPSVPDLIVAATAELAGLTVVHLDKDFDPIAEVTGLPTERLAAACHVPRRHTACGRQRIPQMQQVVGRSHLPLRRRTVPVRRRRPRRSRHSLKNVNHNQLRAH